MHPLFHIIKVLWLRILLITITTGVGLRLYKIIIVCFSLVYDFLITIQITCNMIDFIVTVALTVCVERAVT